MNQKGAELEKTMDALYTFVRDDPTYRSGHSQLKALVRNLDDRVDGLLRATRGQGESASRK